jgi:hypothetical protein
MADTVDALVGEVQSIVDVSPAEALTALNRRYRAMVARSRLVRKRLAVGPTVASQSFYPVSGVVELLGVSVNGVPYGKGAHTDFYGAALGSLTWSGPGGLVVADASSAGVSGVSLIPTPTEAGLSIELFAAVFPADLAAGGAASTIVVDPDFLDVLVEAAASTYLRRQGEGDPNTSDARFDQACEELRRRVNHRYRSSGPAQIRVQGVNA